MLQDWTRRLPVLALLPADRSRRTLASAVTASVLGTMPTRRRVGSMWGVAQRKRRQAEELFPAAYRRRLPAAHLVRWRPSFGGESDAIRTLAALNRCYCCGPRTLALGRLTLFDRVFDLLTFGQIVKAMIRNGRVVKEDIFTTIRLNETEPFVLNQLLNLTDRHA